MIISPCTVGITEICSRLKALIMLRHDFKMAKLSDFKQFYLSFTTLRSKSSAEALIHDRHETYRNP